MKPADAPLARFEHADELAMRSWLASQIVFPLYERLSGRRPWTELRRLRVLQWRSPEELEARAVAKLRPLFTHAYDHVPYYHDLFDQAGVRPDDVHTVSDLSRLPLTTKADLRSNYPSRTVADNLPPSRRYKTHTSGSTGLPFEFYNDRAEADVRLASYRFFWEWAGIGLGDGVAHIPIALRPSSSDAGSSRWIRAGRQFLLGERVVLVSGLDLSATTLRAGLRQLPRRSEYILWGLPSAIAHLAVGLLEGEAKLPACPKAVIATGETLTVTDAAAIERAFRCPVVNHYSSYEALHLAQTCPDNPAMLHANSERAVLRVVREDGSTAAAGEPGRIVVTNLGNWVMPFINYDTGDWAVAGGPCRCGRGFPTLLSLEGRMGEAIRTPGGKRFSPILLGWFLAHVREALPYIWEFQAVQIAADSVVLRIVPTPSFTAAFARELEGALAEFLGPGLDVRIVTVDRIAAEPSGKRLVIKAELA